MQREQNRDSCYNFCWSGAEPLPFGSIHLKINIYIKMAGHDRAKDEHFSKGESSIPLNLPQQHLRRLEGV